jgi:hydrogenase maturation protein HypF
MNRRLAISIQGVVQGVGFRPFVYRTAVESSLSGWVRNRPDGVRIEVQGPAERLDRFLEALRQDHPRQAVIDSIEVREIAPADDAGQGFEILTSDADAEKRPSIPADLATCPECQQEIESTAERRFAYPFTNCTNCGPRYSIIESLPYDRPRTSMKSFSFCPECEAEYRNPLDRRFHAQPIACPRCGPRLELLAHDGRSLACEDEALRQAIEAVLAGKVLALKGLGGFQLLVDATDDRAVNLLRERKHREAKPLAVMFPSLEALRQCCSVSSQEAEALLSPQAPILLVRRLTGGPTRVLAESVAPGNPRVGAMLPYTPLHRLLLAGLERPVVCTSGNLSDEPMCVETREALARLGKVADLFLVHDRPIVRPVDDSVAKVGPRGLELLRRARGFAPLPIRLKEKAPTILAVGGHLKCTAALSLGDQVIVSQHLGDLDSAEGAALLERTVDDLLRFFDARPEMVACDLHPEYVSTRIAERIARNWSIPLERVQHHHAHVAACVAEQSIEGEVLGLAWDGTGWGLDGTIWGGEALACAGPELRRFASLRPFRLPGGEMAMREPRRSALGLLHEAGELRAKELTGQWFSPEEFQALCGILERQVSSPVTSSIGRLFDAVSAVLGIRLRNGFEGQAAMELEFAADGVADEESYPLLLVPRGDLLLLDWAPMLEALLAERDHGIPVPILSARFHNSLADGALAIARQAAIPKVVLCGGCFQNDRLTRTVRERLEGSGFEVFIPRRVPPNDGSISLGQVLVAARRRSSTSESALRLKTNS